MDNPLLVFDQLPPFSRIEPDQVEPALDQLLTHNRERIANLLEPSREPTWANLVYPIEILEDRLSQAWSPVRHLNSVRNTPELRAAYNACLPKLSDYATEMGQNERLWQAYRTIREQARNLDPVQVKVLDLALRDFHLAGVDLPAPRKARFKAISQRLAQLGSHFEEQVLDATQAWTRLITDPADLAGLPDSALALAHQTGELRGHSGWLLTLEQPSYLPVLTYADDRDLRREVYTAYVTRASDQGPMAGRWDNGPLMEEILALRHEQAQLLGFANYAELSLATKMAPSPQAVVDFLTDLARRSRPQAERELAELAAFAKQEQGLDHLEAWDPAYFGEKLRQRRFSIAQEELRPYFPASRVVAGLFAVAERLFGVLIEEVEGVDVWHPDVRFYAVRDWQQEIRGHFYLDLHARPHKRGGAWMDGCRDRLLAPDGIRTPVAYLTCNLNPPLGDQPALLTHEEVRTLFHEFGHGLHHLLTRVDHPPVAGINGVAWDAVELPSQFMENWCWQRESLNLIAGHWQTGAPLPDDLFQRLGAARNFQSGLQMLRQLEFALFDFRLHLDYTPQRGGRVQQTLTEIRDQVAVVRPPAWNRFAHGFTHIFAGGYAAGYYSYKWAEVLSADAFSLFEERGIFDPGAGRGFLENILEKGGSEDAMDLYLAFRGRPPQVEALLRQSGIQ